MKDLRTHVYEAVLTALDAMDLPRGVRVFGHIPKTDDRGREIDIQPPYITLGEIRAEPVGEGSGFTFQRVTIEIIATTRTPARADMHALQMVIFQALDEQALPSPGALLGPLMWQSSDDALEDDDVTYTGSQYFETLAQYAD